VTSRRRRDDAGTALIEVTWLGILLMVPLVYIVLSVFDVQRGAFGVSAGSRAAARAYALAPDQATGQARAEAAARLAMRDQGLEADPTVRVTCRPNPRDCLQPKSIIVVDIATQVDLPLMPTFLGGDTPSFRLSSHHEVPYGTFREGSE
jgi:Flp pilus assembly protein TadG